MLNAMKKGTTVEQNERAIKWAKEAGILVAISVIAGYPGETPDMLKQTIDFRKRSQTMFTCARQYHTQALNSTVS